MSRDPNDIARRAREAQAIRDHEEGRAGKLFKVFGDWLTTDDNDELLGKVDRTLGTSLQKGAREAAGEIAQRARDVAAGVREEDRVSRRGAAPTSPTSDQGQSAIDIEDRPGPIVIVKRRPTCATCRGEGAIEFDEATKRTRPIPCPSCGVRPKKASL